MVSCCYRYLFFIFQANYSLGDFSFLANLPVGKSVLGGLSLGDLGSWRIRVLGEIVLGGLSLGKLGLLANLTWPFCTWRISTWQIGVYPDILPHSPILLRGIAFIDFMKVGFHFNILPSFIWLVVASTSFSH